MRTMFAFVFVATMSASAGGAQTTRGDIWDKNAAIDVQRCFNQYSHLTTASDRHEYWQMCLEVTADLSGRPIANIRQQVIERVGHNVFARNN